MLARDPDELARQVRRPMPRPPAREARRGTEFHHWLEERFGQQRLIGDEELFAEPDEPETGGDLAELRARFEAGEWGGRWPREVEVPFDTLIGDRQVRGRIDAVFGDADGGFDVVDWKTGKPPWTKAEKGTVAVQLAAYRLAWSALAGVPLEKVRAAFYYVRQNRTVRPADLLDEAGLLALINRVPVAETDAETEAEAEADGRAERPGPASGVRGDGGREPDHAGAGWPSPPQPPGFPRRSTP
jgi:DNA helicase-2/ATP-dependent DNA helicase PcrA